MAKPAALPAAVPAPPTASTALLLAPPAAFAACACIGTYGYRLLPLAPLLAMVAAVTLALAQAWLRPRTLPPSAKQASVTHETLMAALLLPAALMGGLAGAFSFALFGSNVAALQRAHTYTSVSPASPPAPLQDGGLYVFEQSTRVDVGRAAGFAAPDGHVYCAAPVVNDAVDPAQAVTFFAVGVDCCVDRGDFWCGGATATGAKAVGVAELAARSVAASRVAGWALELSGRSPSATAPSGERAVQRSTSPSPAASQAPSGTLGAAQWERFFGRRTRTIRALRAQHAAERGGGGFIASGLIGQAAAFALPPPPFEAAVDLVRSAFTIPTALVPPTGGAGVEAAPAILVRWRDAGSAGGVRNEWARREALAVGGSSAGALCANTAFLLWYHLRHK